MPSNEQLAQFARRLRRAMREEKSRTFFGVSCGEGDFTFYPDVLRVVQWIETSTNASTLEPENTEPQRVSLRKAAF